MNMGIREAVHFRKGNKYVFILTNLEPSEICVCGGVGNRQNFNWLLTTTFKIVMKDWIL